MENTSADTVMEYLTSRRMSSLGNVAMHFDCPVSELSEIVKLLQRDNRLRYSQPRCGSSCSSCSGCPSEGETEVLSEQTILISLEKKEDNQ